MSVLRISGGTTDDGYLDSWSSRLSLEGLPRRAREARSPELSSG
ncbi:MAG TPA: hypothetical protein VHM25_04980 [Polyangiaceae bacterium]|nr:hypothetical protein [Polyangiaceae bacterium]